ncbi:unnamed protein product [Spirodela intermedia]|uniref:Uncharacterized protein n=1 Tax=Spirodela intermedia TaxID=51605 RepID=A0A7I8LIK8_SPIIN|nr:unnamed protein product [Spirodela intermedia]
MSLKTLYVSFLLEGILMWFSLHSLVDLRVEDFESIDSKTDFFSKIGVLWIQT